MTQEYKKTWLSFSKQVEKLKSYGLEIKNPLAAEFFLQHINYYRFCGYGLIFEEQRHKYREGTTFEQIRSLYEFDRTLRDLLGEALEIIELDFRTVVAYRFGEAYEAFGHTDRNNFYRWKSHAEWLKNVQEHTSRSTDLFVKHFKEKYNTFPNLPIWVLTETMSFGSISQMYQHMDNIARKTICSRYGLQPDDLGSWIHHLVYIRNICAHHSRIWDRTYSIAPARPPSKSWQAPSVPSNDKLFITLLVVSQMLKYCVSEKAFISGWKKRMMEHLNSNKSVVPGQANDTLAKHAGFCADWENHPLWKN